MKNMLYVLLLTGFSLIIISCGKKDSTSSTTSTETTTSVSYVSVGTNGTTWTSRTSGTSNGLQRVIYANSTFVTVGDSGTILTYHKPFRIILPYFVSPPRKMGLPFNGQKNKKIRGHET